MSTRELTFRKIDGTWYYTAGTEGPNKQYRMPNSTIAILEFAAGENSQVTFRLLRKNTLENVKIALGRVKYLKGGALYYVLEYTGAQYGTKDLKRRKIWIGNTTRKTLKNFPSVINLTW